MEFKERYLRSMLVLLDTSRGTLWMVAEPVWIRNVPHYVDKGRKCHVGLSVDKRNCQSITDVLKLLIGTSRTKGVGIVVEDCFGDQSGRTSFFRLRPYSIPFSEAYDEQLGTMIKQNSNKTRLTSAELAKLDSLLMGKGDLA